MSKLKDYISESGEYIIPVTWSVFGTFRVKARNLEEARRIAEEHLDNIPLSGECDYVDGSYRISADTDEELLAAQNYKDRSDILLLADGTVIE